MPPNEFSITENHLSVVKTARYFTIGKLDSETKYVWIVCHGYGMLASSFIKWFKPIISDDMFVVAPEGLSKFYWKGFSDKPVASWMTKEDRLNEINDYSQYLSKLLAELQRNAKGDVKIVCAGFSQGCATVMRWLQKSKINIDHIVLFSGTVPEDIQYDLSYFESIDKHILFGDNDPFINGEMVKKAVDGLAVKQLAFSFMPFEGKHEIEAVSLQKIAAQIRSSM